MDTSLDCDLLTKEDFEMAEDFSDLPTSLIITNIEPAVFTSMPKRREFEAILRAFDENVTFQYLKSFKRVRVNFVDADSATRARLQCHEMKFGENLMNCYFAQPIEKDNNNESGHLQPPRPYKQFLISPPSSPPVGWEPIEEAEPCINYDILSALASLAPGETHELHPASEEHPGIVVHICEEDTEKALNVSCQKIIQTSRPPIVEG